MIGFVGPFGDSNYGDYAMFVNDVYSLHQQRITVFSYNSCLLDSLEKDYLKQYSIDKCIVEVGYQYEEKLTDKYYVEYDLRAYTPYEILEFITNIDDVRHHMKRIQTLVVCGGGYLNHIWNANHRKNRLFAILGTILIAREQKKQICFMGNTYGPFCESANLYSAFFSTLGNTVLAARDEVFSKSELRKLGYTGEIKTIPDDLYFLNDKLMDTGERIVPYPYILFECYASIDEINNHIEDIRRFVSEMKLRYGMSVLFCPLDKKYGGEYQGEIIKRSISDMIYKPICGPYLRVEYINNLVRYANLVVSQRYHLFLTALSLNTPCVQALKETQGDFRYYYSKSKGLLQQVFANQVYEDRLFLSKSIWNALVDIEENFPDIQKKQKALFNDYKKESEDKMKQLRDQYLIGIE